MPPVVPQQDKTDLARHRNIKPGTVKKYMDAAYVKRAIPCRVELVRRIRDEFNIER